MSRPLPIVSLLPNLRVQSRPTPMPLPLAAGAVLIYASLSNDISVSGWSSMMSIPVLGGLTIFCVCVIGVDLARTFAEAQHRVHDVRALDT